MVRFIKNIVWKFLNIIGLGGITQIYLGSALVKYGWFRSYSERQSVDADGNPLPWYTYSFIFFLESHLLSHFEVFEYGSGNSTRWFAERVKQVTAVEHESEWVKQISAHMPSNADILLRELGDEYIRAVKEKNTSFNIIVVDGRKRVKCVEFAVNFLTPDGVLILDNSQREWYKPARDIMKEL